MNEENVLSSAIDFVTQKSGKRVEKLEIVSQKDRLRTDGTVRSKIWLVRICFSSSETRFFYIKHSNTGLAYQSFVTEKAVEVFTDDDKVMLPGIIGSLDSHTMIIERLEGRLLDELLIWRPPVNPISWYRYTTQNVVMVGQWLRTFHNATKCAKTPDMNALQNYVKSRIDNLSVLPSNTKAKLLECLKVPLDGPVAIIHGDFNPHNILISSTGKIGVIDFGMIDWQYMTPWWDVAAMLVNIQRVWINNFCHPGKLFPEITKKILSSMMAAYGEFPENNRSYTVCLIIHHFMAFRYEYKSGNCVNRTSKWHLKQLNLLLESLEKS